MKVAVGLIISKRFWSFCQTPLIFPFPHHSYRIIMFTTHLHDPNDLRYSFYVVWFDALASLNREYTLLYYTADNTIEMVCSYELFL